MLRDKCYHEVVEENFENLATHVWRGQCEDLCSCYTGDHKNFSGDISKELLVGHLQTNAFDRGTVSADKFVTFLTDKTNVYKINKSVWGQSTSVPAGMIHGLVLMLIAADLVKTLL